MSCDFRVFATSAIQNLAVYQQLLQKSIVMRRLIACGMLTFLRISTNIFEKNNLSLQTFFSIQKG
jgi:hypothetical protein